MQMKPRDFLMVFLTKLEEFVPPPEKCHHVICYAKYGHDTIGWEPKLAVMVNTKGKFVTFFLEDEDFEKDPETLAGDIAKTWVRTTLTLNMRLMLDSSRNLQHDPEQQAKPPRSF